MPIKAVIQLRDQQLRVGGGEFPLAAGMQLIAETIEDRRTVLEYLLSPVQRVVSEGGAIGDSVPEFTMNLRTLCVRAMLTGVAAMCAVGAMAAPRYRLTTGKGYAYCEAFLKNLNAFPATDPPMICEQKLHPSHPELSDAKWEELDIQSNLKLIYAAEGLHPMFTHVGTKQADFATWRTRFEERIASGQAKPRLRQARLTISPRGSETILAYDPGIVAEQCDVLEKQNRAGVGSGSYLYVLRDPESAGLEPIVGVTDTETRVLRYRSKVFLVWSTGGYQSLKRSDGTIYDTKPVWTILLQTIAPTLSSEGFYVGGDDCRISVDLKGR
jgi:hypothetical protein